MGNNKLNNANNCEHLEIAGVFIKMIKIARYEEEERKILIDIFNILDRNGDGDLTPKEAKKSFGSRRLKSYLYFSVSTFERHHETKKSWRRVKSC